MGFLKKLKKATGKLLKGAVQIGGPTLVGQLPVLGGVVASKLRTMGENRTRQKLLAKTDLAKGIAVKRLTPGGPTVSDRPPKTTSPGLPALIAMRDPAVRELLNKEQAKGERAAVQGNVSNKKKAAAIWGKLDQDTRDELLRQFKAKNPKGTDAAWAKFVIANG